MASYTYASNHNNIWSYPEGEEYQLQSFSELEGWQKYDDFLYTYAECIRRWNYVKQKNIGHIRALRIARLARYLSNNENVVQSIHMYWERKDP